MISNEDEFGEQSDEDISIDLPLMRLVYHDDAVLQKIEVRTHLIEQDPISHKLYFRLRGVTALMSDLIPYELS